MQTTSWLLQIGGIVTLSFLVPLACADPPPTSAPDPVVHDPVAGTPVTQTTPVQECTVSPAASSVRAVVNGGTVKIKLTVPRTSCANYRVRTEDGSAWARVASSQPVRGSQTVAIAVTRNSGAERSVRMLVTNLAGNKVLGRFTVLQAGVPCAPAKLAEARYDAGDGPLVKSIALTAPAGCKWKAVSDAGFLAVAPASGTGAASITLSAGITTASREARVAVTDQSTRAIIGVVQVTQMVKAPEGPSSCGVRLSPASLPFAAGSASASTEAAFISGACTVRAQSSASWMTVSSAPFQRTTSLAITVEANSGNARAGAIQLVDTLTRQIVASLPVLQAARSVETSNCTSVIFSPQSLHLADTAQTVAVIVRGTDAACEGTVSVSQPWATVIPGAFVGTTSLRIVVGANTSTSSARSVIITARMPGGTTGRMTITQAARFASCTVSLKSTSTTLASTADLANIDMTRMGNCASLALVVSDPWLAATMPSANVLRVTTTANVGGARAGDVRVVDQRTGAVLARLTVQQVAAPRVPVECSYTVSPSFLSLSTAFHRIAIQIVPSSSDSACASWSVSSSGSWLSVFGSHHSGTATISGSVSANAGVTPRAGALTIRGAGGAFSVISVSQAGHAPPQPSVTLNPGQLNLSNGYQQVSVQVTTDANTCYEVLGSASWISARSGTHLCGPKILVFYVDFNAGSVRSTTVQVGGTPLVVTQLGTR